MDRAPITPITKSVRGLTQWAGSTWENYFWLIGTEKDNEQLRRRGCPAQARKQRAAQQPGALRARGKLVDYQRGLASQTTLAQVIGKGANSNSREIFISRGLDAGVTAGMPVITPDGIVGKVQASYPSAALVMLISDPEAGVGVLLANAAARRGFSKEPATRSAASTMSATKSTSRSGETVYTSGDDRVFPKGLRIGEGLRLGRGTDFQQIQVKPFAALDRLEEVLVITKGVHQDLPESPQAQPPQYLMPLPTTSPSLYARARRRASEPAAAEQPAEGRRRQRPGNG